MLYLEIYRNHHRKGAYFTVTYVTEDKLNLLLYQINFSDTKIHLLKKHEVYTYENTHEEKLKPFQNELKGYKLYKSIVLKVPETTLYYFSRNNVFNLI